MPMTSLSVCLGNAGIMLAGYLFHLGHLPATISFVSGRSVSAAAFLILFARPVLT